MDTVVTALGDASEAAAAHYLNGYILFLPFTLKLFRLQKIMKKKVDLVNL